VKEVALGTVVGRLGRSMSQVVAIGDDLNDIRMLRVAGLGATRATAPHAVRKAASVIYRNLGGRGLAEFLAHVLDIEGGSPSS
jgi:hydroxymethylpyrimidine pyrophosphatase-like HAD family hydrolase